MSGYSQLVYLKKILIHTGLMISLCFSETITSLVSCESWVLASVALTSASSMRNLLEISAWCWPRVPSQSSSQSRVILRSSLTRSRTSDIVLLDWKTILYYFFYPVHIDWSSVICTSKLQKDLEKGSQNRGPTIDLLRSQRDLGIGPPKKLSI